MEEKKIKLSIIVSGYNAEPHLRECLESLANQTLPDIQVLMVKEGLEGEASKTMDDYAELYENFEVVHHAGNSIISYAKGDYIAFVSSEHRVRAKGYEKMYKSAITTGSEIVTGAVDCFGSKKRFRSPLHKKALYDTVYKTNITQRPELIYDTTIWNKLYKKSFWEARHFSFPVGMLYDDMALTVSTHFFAQSVDIISDVIYHWYTEVQNDAPITKSLSQYEKFTNHMKALRTVDTFFKENNVSEEVRIAKDYRWLDIDYRLFMRSLLKVDAEDLQKVQKEMADELKKIHPKAFRQLPVLDRMKYQLILENKVDALMSLLRVSNKALRQYKPHLENGRYFVNYPHSELFSKDFMDVTDELPFVSRITEVTWEDANISVHGHTYINGLDSKRQSDVHLQVNIVNVLTGKSFAADSELLKNSQITRKWGVRKEKALLPIARVYNYDWSDFKIRFNVQEALAKLGKGLWKLEVDLQVRGVKRKAFLASPIKGTEKAENQFIDGFKVFPKYNGVRELTFCIEEIKHLIQNISLGQDKIIVQGWRESEISGTELTLNYKDEERCFPLKPLNELSVLQTDHADALYPYYVDIPIQEFYELEDNQSWKAMFKNPSGIGKENSQAYFDSESISYIWHEKEIIGRVDGDGALRLYFHPHLHPIVTNVGWETDESLSVTMEYNKNYHLEIDEITKQQLVAVSREDGKEYRYDVTKQGDADAEVFEAQICLIDEHGNMYLAAGAWDFYFETHGYKESESKVIRSRVVVDEEVTADVDSKINSSIRTTVYRTVTGYFSLRNSLHWSKLENDSRKKKIIKYFAYPLFRLLPVKKKTVVFQSFGGNSYSDSPKAIHEYMQSIDADYQYVWFLNNENTHVDGNVKKVRKNSWKYWYYLARGKYFIANTNFPNDYVKRTGQIEVQTLQGTSLKTAGLDVPSLSNALAKRNALIRRSGRWDYLITPSDYMTDIAKKAYFYQNDVLEVGFPKNDFLDRNNNAAYINEIKQKLNLPMDKKILLYAPTYRSKDDTELHLDIDELYKKFGDEYIILLNFHYLDKKSFSISKYLGFAYNVSSYLDKADLHLISDALITDYSSVMFDYAHLGRPIIFYAYDLEKYRDQLRGMYLDYEAEMPGPIVQDTEEIAAVLPNLNEVKEEYSDKLKSFYDTYCMYDKGEASKKVYERVFLGETQLQKGEAYFRNKWQKKLKSGKVRAKILNFFAKFPSRNTVVFESFAGKQYSDSPKALYNYMREHHSEYKLYWSAEPEYMKSFEGLDVNIITRFSLRWFYVMARSKYWVCNARMPLWITKPKHTTYIQTWHGTPLKKLVFDMEEVHMPGTTTAKYKRNFYHESRNWDYLLSPNGYSSEIFRRAFRFEKELLEYGYPRNDVLHNGNTEENITAIKEKLGIPLDKKIILYAPTWRDNQFYGLGQYKFDLPLDLKVLQNLYGDKYVILLRMHYLVAENFDLGPYEGFAYDFSKDVDINDLYLVSDLLITDYSSVFFDYANLQRPMVFYTYDIDEYRDTLRGFYFDLEKEVPGPLVKDMDSFIKVLEEFDKHGDFQDYQEKYEAFYQKFCYLESGNSSRDVVQHIFLEK